MTICHIASSFWTPAGPIPAGVAFGPPRAGHVEDELNGAAGMRAILYLIGFRRRAT